MKKILHLLNTGSFSGAERVVVTIIDWIKKLYPGQFEFFYASPNGAIQKVLEEYQISYVSIPSFNVRELRKITKTVKPDIIHAHDFTTSIVAALSFTGVPTISHLHQNPPWLKHMGFKSMAYASTSVGYKKVLVVSEKVLEEYVFGNVINKKTLVVGNPVETGRVITRAQEVGDAKGYDVIFMGRLSTPKNPIAFLNIIEKVSKSVEGLKAAIIGSGELEQEVRDRIGELELEAVVDMLGYQENPYGIVQNSKVLCMPSLWEGFGLAAVEALVLGKPVVASKVGGLTKIVDSRCGNLCGSEDEFVEEIKTLLLKKEIYLQKSKEALKRGSQFENIEEYMKQIYDTYLSISKE